MCFCTYILLKHFKTGQMPHRYFYEHLSDDRNDSLNHFEQIHWNWQFKGTEIKFQQYRHKCWA